MSRTSFCSAFLLVLGTSSVAMAVPTVYPRPEITNNNAVTNNSNATVLRDSVNRKALYVLPPAMGAMDLPPLAYGANVGFCEEMRYLQTATLRLVKKIDSLYEDVDTQKADLDALVAQRSALELEKAEYIGASDYKRLINDTIQEADDLDFQMEGLYEQLDACYDDECIDKVQVQIDALQEEINAVRATLRDLRSQYRADYLAIAKLKNKIKAVEDSIDAVFESVDDVVAQLAKARSQFMTMYRDYATLEGAIGSINYDTKWGDAVNTVKGDNPGFSVQAIDTKDVRFNLSAIPGIGTDNYLQSLPQVLGYSIGGKEYNPQEPTLSLDAFPAAINGTLRLSLIGACPQLHPDYFDIPTSAQGKPLVGVIGTYTYPSAFRTTVSATFNLWTFYQHYKEVQKKGGLFRTSTKTYESIYDNGASGITITIADESGMSAEQITEIRNEILDQIVMDMARMVATPSYGGMAYSSYQVIPLQPPASAMAVFGKGVADTCGWYNVYCRGISWLFAGIDAVFGSSKAEANFQKSYDRTVTRHYSTDSVQYRSGITSFAGTGE